MLLLLALLGLAVLVATALALVRLVVDDAEQIDRTAERLLGSSSPGRLDGQD